MIVCESLSGEFIGMSHLDFGVLGSWGLVLLLELEVLFFQCLNLVAAEIHLHLFCRLLTISHLGSFIMTKNNLLEILLIIVSSNSIPIFFLGDESKPVCYISYVFLNLLIYGQFSSRWRLLMILTTCPR